MAKSGALAREGGGEDEREEGEEGARGEEQLSEIQQTLGFEFFQLLKTNVHTQKAEIGATTVFVSTIFP